MVGSARAGLPQTPAEDETRHMSTRETVVSRTTRITITFAAVLAVGLGLGACSSEPGGQERAERLTIGLITEPSSFDPAQAPEGTRLPLYQAVYDTLLLREPDGTLAPMLAESWTLDDDRTRLTLELRDDVTFIDGTPFDSSVVKSNLERFKTENGPQAIQLAALETVETPDATTAVLVLSEPDPALPIYLSNAAGLMASADALEDPDLDSVPIGSGPYTLVTDETTVGVQYVYTRNEDYWGEDLPYDEIVFSVLPDEQAQFNALMSGQINSTVLFTQAAGEEATEAGFTYWPSETDYQGLVLFDRDGDSLPALGDVRVRQAINFAIDRELLLDTFLLGRGTTTTQIWGPDSLGYVEGLEDVYEYDPEEARRLLAEAGYADGLDVTLPTVPQFDPELMAVIIQMLQEVGINATLEDLPFADFFDQLRGAEHAVSYMAFFQPGDWQLIQQFIAPDAPWNSFHTTEPLVEQLIDEIRVADEADIETLAEELNTFVVEQAWFAPFYRVELQLFTDENTAVEPQVEQASPSIYNYSPVE